MAERIAILNGFGRTLGDSIIGLQALHATLELNPGFGAPVLYRLPGLGPLMERLYRLAEFADLRDLPWPHSTRETSFSAADCDAVIDIRDFAYDNGFLRHSMIDFFLSRLGLDPATVGTAAKRNSWLAPRMALTDPELSPDYILVCPNSANPMRSMPDAFHAAVVSSLRRHACVVTQGRATGKEVVSRPHEASLESLCALVARARCVVSTDTAAVHLADAFEVPCLAFFPTHDPDWRVRDYPLCTPVRLDAGAAAGLEFPRSAADLQAASNAWFPHGADLSWLDRTLGDFLGSLRR